MQSDSVEAGLPAYTPLHLRDLILSLGAGVKWDVDTAEAKHASTPRSTITDSIGNDDLIVGGPEHLTLVKQCLERAQSNLIIHSCFISPKTIEFLLPDLAKAAQRKVRIDLLWGLRADPEDPASKSPISDSEKVLDQLDPTLRTRVQLSPNSSGSHSKVIIFDDAQNNSTWTSVIGSCNYLSSNFDSIEISLRSRSLRLAKKMLSHLLTAQLPASNAWPPVARRMDRIWDRMTKAIGIDDVGPHNLTIIVDQDHYACVRAARDESARNIVIGCDLFGVAAETSVLVPMQRAAELGKRVQLFYNRPSIRLSEEGRRPNINEMSQRGLEVKTIDELHGKFLAWDCDAVAVTSFNWMSTVAEGTRARGAELGILVEAPGIRSNLADKLYLASAGQIDIRWAQPKEAPEHHQ